MQTFWFFQYLREYEELLKHDPRTAPYDYGNSNFGKFRSSFFYSANQDKLHRHQYMLLIIYAPIYRRT